MKRIDYYIFGVVALTIYLFTLFTETSLFSSVESSLKHGSSSGWVKFFLFVAGVTLTLNILISVIKILTNSEESEIKPAKLSSVYINILLLIVTYAALQLFEAFVSFDLYSAY